MDINVARAHCLIPQDGSVWMVPNFIAQADADRLFDTLTLNLPWQQKQIRMFGKWINLPRLTCWVGDPGCSYTYSGLTESPLPWTPELLEIRQLLLEQASIICNSVLANLYRSGQDSMGWHSDDEKELGQQPVIASISLGAERRFDLRHRHDADMKVSLNLPHGSLLVMEGLTQTYWKHQVPKEPATRVTGPRINLTFRTIL